MVDSRGQGSGGFVIELNADRASLLGQPLTVPGGQPLLPSSGAVSPTSTPKFSTEWGGSFPSPFYDWLAGFIGGKSDLKRIRIFAADFSGKPRVELELPSAQLAHVVFPDLDAASTELARIRAVIQAPPAPWTKSDSGTVVVPLAPAQQKWTAAQFHLTIAGLSTAKVSKIDGVSFVAPGKCAQFAITVHPLEIAPFNAWLKTKEPRQATLVYYRPNLQPVCTLSFPALRIAAIDAPTAKADTRGVQASMAKYIVHLTPGSATFATG
jgi:hypothetical protein